MSNELVKKEELGDQSFIERLVSKAESLEEIKNVGMVIINSGFCPSHFQQSKDAVGVIMCIEAGKKLGLTWMQSLSDIYPVKGRIGIMGTLAKALILSSGLCESWEDIIEGTYPNLDYKHIIVSKRKGFPKEFRTEFSLFDAKTAGLMDKAIYKTYGKRMIMWRAVGFHATDYYNDLLKGMKTVEELNDFDETNLTGKPEGTTTIIGKSGKEMKVAPDTNEKSEKISASVVDKIDKANGVHKEEPIQEAEIIPDNEPEVGEYKPKIWTAEELTEMKDGIYEKIKEILPPAKVTLLASLKGRKSNRLYRDAVLYFQNGQLDNWLMGEMQRRDQADVEEKAGVSQTKEETPVDGSDIDKVFEQKQQGITTKQATESFEAEKKVPAKEGEFVVPPFGEDGKRKYSDMVKLYNDLLKLGVDRKAVADWKVFLTEAPEEEILLLAGK